MRHAQRLIESGRWFAVCKSNDHEVLFTCGPYWCIELVSEAGQQPSLPTRSPDRSERRRERIEELRGFIADNEEYRTELLALEKLEQETPTRNDEEGD